MQRTLEIIAFAVVLLLAGLAIHAWLSSRDDQLRLQATLATQKQLIDAADARERDRATSLNATLAQIAALKRTTQTPEEILRDLPNYLSLPQPLTLSPSSKGATAKQGSAASSKSAPTSELAESGSTRKGIAACPEGNAPPECSSRGSVSPSSPSTTGTSVTAPQELPASPSAQIPTVDLKPLYDFVQDCRACQAQLASAKLDAADNATKITALTRERDAATTAAKGGGFWLRLRRNVLWFAVGVGAGAVALCSTGHCRP
ncbi:MAG: hypothetical protein WB780_03015 [Candidatus Acidiferrales bacterium]